MMEGRVGKKDWHSVFPSFHFFFFAFSFILFLLSFHQPVLAATIQGRVTDELNVPLPFTNVFIKGSTFGTTANIDGYYTLEVNPGEFVLVFRLMGFKQHEEKIFMKDASIDLTIQLKSEFYQLKEVRISANAEDPAYEIIRNAQKKRKFYLNEVESYSCRVYVKSTQKLLSYPKKFFGKPVNLREMVDSTTGIFYLSESVSKLSVQQPDQVREEMISSKVSGNAKTYSFNQASDLMLSFYENLIDFEGIAPRGLVSPISSNAMLFYNYRLEGSFRENGKTVNKINVVPKRKNDPVFRGDIYILDDVWRIYSVDLFAAKEQLMEFMDTFRIHQTYIPVGENVWMALSNRYSFDFSFMGFRGNGNVLGINSDYRLNPGFENNFFSGEIMKVNKAANEKDSTYWSETRQVPLTVEESRDYVKRDSSNELHESKAYRDSIDKKNNQFSVTNIFMGYDYKNSFKDRYWSFFSLLKNIQFNTVEGWNAGLDIRYSEKFGKYDRRERNVSSTLRYGFSNTHFNGKVHYEYRYKPEKFATYRISAGTEVNQFNSNMPVTELVNSLYTLLAEKNFMKIYEQRFFRLSHRSEIVNGFRLGLMLEYAQRLPLSNKASYRLVNVDNREYSSNDPLNPLSDDYRFEKNNSFKAEVDIRIRFRQEYITRPAGKFITGTKYPELRIQYRKGVHAAGSDVDYDFIRTGFSDNIGFGLFGKLSYEAFYGKFLSGKRLAFIDYVHFNGNKTIVSGFALNDFKLLDYYRFSTSDPFIEAHVENNFKGFILNKIPLIRKLKLGEIAGIHFLHTSVLKNYFEFSVGIEKLNVLRIDFVTSFADGNKVKSGVVFGIKGIF